MSAVPSFLVGGELSPQGWFGSLCTDSRASRSTVGRGGEATVDDEQQRELREGAGDAFSSAFELIVTPTLFGMLGWFIDSQLGLFPLFTLALTLLVLGYETWRVFSRYNADMDAELEARRAAYGRAGSTGEVGA